MQMIADFLPLLLFLGGYLYADLYFAIKVLMVAMPIGFLLKYAATKQVDKMYLGSTIFLLIMGGLTIAFRDPLFLYWKPTAFYWVLTLVFAGSLWVGDKSIAERMFGKIGTMLPEQWRALTIAWAVFFAIAGILNIYVAFSYSEAFWVNFKVFGLTAITFVFGIAQAVWMMRVMPEQDDDEQQPETE